MTIPQRSRWHYSLRALFAVVMLCGAFLGWLGVQLKWSRDRDEALRWLHDVRARQIAVENGSPVPARKGRYVSHAGIKAPWSLRIFGKAGAEELVVNSDCLGPDGRYSLAELRRLFPEAEVSAVSLRSIPQAAGKEWLIMTDSHTLPSGETVILDNP